jgi:WD40 repeat protein/serine/threonine protein kinase
MVPYVSLLTLRPVAAESAGGSTEEVTGRVAERLGALGPRLAPALAEAIERTWKGLEIALAGAPARERVESALTTPETQPLRNALRTFWDTAPLADRDPAFRQEALRELRVARSRGQLAEGLDIGELARTAALSWTGAAPHETERATLEKLAGDLRLAGLARLAEAIDAQATQPVWLAEAARFFWERAGGPGKTTASVWTPGLTALAEALERDGGRIDPLLSDPTPAASTAGVFDLAAELRSGDPQVRPLAQQVLQALEAHRLADRPLRAFDCLSVHGTDERRRLQQLIARYLALPDELRRAAPALRNGVAKLHVLVGDLAAARNDFQALAERRDDPAAQAEALANFFEVALEERTWPEAVVALTRAATLQPDRFSLFPLAQYEPVSVLHNGGSSVTFLCRHRNSGAQVIVEALRADLLERPAAAVFADARALESLELPALLRLRDCDYADAARSRPYLVREFFEGQTLADYVGQHGPLAPADLVAVSRPLAEAVEGAHARGVLHGDLRPANVWIRKDPTGWKVKVLHFGLGLRRSVLRDVLRSPAARIQTTLGVEVARTAEAASPEQLGRLPGIPPGPYSDVYGFGRIAYFALLRTSDPDDEEKDKLPQAWRRLLGQCTAYMNTRRPADLGVVRRLLTPGNHEPAPPPPTTVREASTVVEAPAIAVPAPAVPAPVGTPPATAVSATPRSELEEAAASCVHRGVMLRQKGDYDAAIAEFTRATRIDPNHTAAYQGRANTYSGRGDYDRAVEDYSKALEIDPKLALAYVNRGLAYVKLHEPVKAVADYTRALEIDPKLSVAYLNRGSAYARSAEYERAVEDYSKALEIDPKLALAYVNRGLAHAKKGDFPAALVDYGRALEIEPTNREAQARKAQAERAIRKPAGARGKRRREDDTPVRVFEGATEAVRAVVCTADGRRVVAGGEDKSVRIWDSATGKKLARLAGHTGPVLCVAVGPDSDIILSGSQDHTLRLWDVEGSELRRFGGGLFFGGNAHADAVSAVAFSPDGHQALSASWDKTIRLWDVNNGREVRGFEGHQWLIHSVAFSPEGRHFVYGSEDQTLRLCQLEDGQEIRRFEGHGSWVLSVAFSPDGRQLLSGSSDGTMRLWSVARGKEMCKFGGQMGLVQSVAFSPDGRRALSGEYTLPGDNTVMRLWDVEGEREITRFVGHKQMIWSVCFSPDGRYGLSASADKTICMWRLPK